MTIFESTYLGITLVMLAYLMIIHWIVPQVKSLESLNTGMINSISSGFSLSFVFLYALPFLPSALESVSLQVKGSFLEDIMRLGYMFSLMVLIGFASYHFLEKTFRKKASKGKELGQSFFVWHMGILMLLHFSVMFVVTTLVTIKPLFAFVFIVAMSSYFFLEEYLLKEYFLGKHRYLSRFLVSLALALGWVCGILMLQSQSALVLLLVGGFISGAILMNIFRIEFYASDGVSHIASFLITLAISSVVILGLLFIEKDFIKL